MAANYVQANFLGGEWSPYYQGRIDNLRYKTAMNRCLNGLPVEEGAWVRRSGSRLMAPAYLGGIARVQPVAMQTAASYSIEFTDTHMRFWNGALPVCTEEFRSCTSISPVSSIDTGAVLNLSAAVDWENGDEIVILPNVPADNCIQLRNRIMKVIPIALGSVDAWAIDTNYGFGEVVTFDGDFYQSLQSSNLAQQPDEEPLFWELLVGTPSNQLKIYDSIDGTAIDSTDIVFDSGNLIVLRLVRLTTPYADGSWVNTRVVQEMDKVFLLNPAYKPQRLKISPNPGDALFATASIDTVEFQDGPFLDTIKNSIATVGGTSGVISVSFGFAAYDSAKVYAFGEYASASGITYRSLVDSNLNHTPSSSLTFWKRLSLGVSVTGEDVDTIGLRQADVGRHVRFWSTPLKYDPAHSYNLADSVLYANIAYEAKAAGILPQPDTDVAKWTVNPTGTRWVWGRIVDVGGPQTCDVLIIDDPLLFAGTVYEWKLGEYSDVVGYPACGTLHEGRLWLGGVIKNRFDGSMTDGTFIRFSPTLLDGTVADNCGIAYTLEADDANQIYWFSPEAHGIVCGTLGGEWLIQASQASDPLTPTSIQAKRVTKYGCANIEPRRTGIALVFVHKFLRQCLEFITDVYSGKFVAPNLNEASKHITKGDIEEIAYQHELAPVVWGRKGDGTFIGATYKRESSVATETPKFTGWHRHELGTERDVESLIVGPSADATIDTMTMVTTGEDQYGTGTRHVEMLADLYQTDDALYDAWFLDGAMVPSSMYEGTVTGAAGQYFTGLWYLNDKTVTVWGGGLDLGDYIVTDGQLFVPYGTGVKPTSIDYNTAGAGRWMFTAAFVQSIFDLQIVPKYGGVFSGSVSGTIEISDPDETLIPDTTTIMAYIPATTFAGESFPETGSSGIHPNWAEDMVTIMSANISKGLRTFQISDALSLAEKSWTLIGTSDHPLLEAGTAYGTNTVGFVLGASNYGPLAEISMDTLTLIDELNGSSTVGNFLSVDGMVNPTAMAGVTAQNLNFIVACGITGRKIDLADPSHTLIHNGDFIREGLVDEGSSNFCSLLASDSQVGIHITSYAGGTGTVFGYYGIIHTIITPVTGGFLGHTQTLHSKKEKGKKKFSIEDVDLFEPSQAGNNFYDVHKIGVLHPSDIRPEWSHFTQVGGIVMDKSDNGTIVMVVNASDALAANYASTTTYAAGAKVTASDGQIYEARNNGTVGINPSHNDNSASWNYSDLQHRYILKLAATTTDIVWKVPINSCKSESAVTAHSDVGNGIYLHMGSVNDNKTADPTSFPVYIIDTVAGAYKVVSVPGVDGPGFYACHGRRYQLMIKLSTYHHTVTGAPEPIGPIPDFTGDPYWVLLTIGSDLSNSPIPSSTADFPAPRPTIEFVAGETAQFPCVVGSCYTSQGQILRPVIAEDIKSQTGPGHGKTRRTHYGSFLWHNAIAVKVGTVFGKLTKAIFKTAEGYGNQLDPDDVKNGITRENLEDDYTFDSMPAWEVTRPYPLSVVSISGFTKTQDV